MCVEQFLCDHKTDIWVQKFEQIYKLRVQEGLLLGKRHMWVELIDVQNKKNTLSLLLETMTVRESSVSQESQKYENDGVDIRNINDRVDIFHTKKDLDSCNENYVRFADVYFVNGVEEDSLPSCCTKQDLSAGCVFDDPSDDSSISNTESESESESSQDTLGGSQDSQDTLGSQDSQGSQDSLFEVGQDTVSAFSVVGSLLGTPVVAVPQANSPSPLDPPAPVNSPPTSPPTALDNSTVKQRDKVKNLIKLVCSTLATVPAAWDTLLPELITLSTEFQNACQINNLEAVQIMTLLIYKQTQKIGTQVCLYVVCDYMLYVYYCVVVLFFSSLFLSLHILLSSHSLSISGDERMCVRCAGS